MLISVQAGCKRSSVKSREGNTMRVFCIGGIVSLLFLAGCATQAGMGVGSPTIRGNEPGLSVEPQPDLGVPESNLNGGTSLFRGPSRGSGPSLGLPEAFADDPPVRSSRFRSPASPPVNQPQRTPSRGTRPQTSAAPTSATSRSPLADEPIWNRAYRSVDLRPIESLVLGNGSYKVALCGSMHGDEPQSVTLVDQLARELRRHPEILRDCTILIVRTANPDGLHGRSAYNVQGVDLNRNFPAPNWHGLRDNRSGSRPGSEAETRAVMQLLEEFRPALLVHVKDSRGEGVVNSEGRSESIAEAVARQTSCRVARNLGEATSGSLEAYALSKLNCASVTLLLPREKTDQAAWERNRSGLLAVFDHSPAQHSGRTSKGLEDDDPFELPRIHPSSLRSTPKSRSSLPEFPKEIPDKGYFELPAP
jgi:murein peptide amidase A